MTRGFPQGYKPPTEFNNSVPLTSSTNNKQEGTSSMANHKSAVKRARQTETKTAVNRSRVSRVRTFVRKVEEAIASGDGKAAKEALKAAQPVIQKAVGKKVVKKNTAARKISRLSARIKKIDK